jgi:hypothetical protein
MPNGGVPGHMLLRPAEGTLVLYCDARVLRIYDQEAWTRERSNATPLATLSEADGAALAWFLRYWLGEAALRPGYEMRGLVQAEFDW